MFVSALLVHNNLEVATTSALHSIEYIATLAKNKHHTDNCNNANKCN